MDSCLTLSNKKFSKEDKCEYESEYESVDESVDESREEDFLKRKIFENDYIKMYVSDARDFVPNIQLWTSQRPLNTGHVNKLIKSLLEFKHITGSFKVVRDKKGEIRLIDGQHRFVAIKTIMEKDSRFNMDVCIDLYETDDFDSENTIELFRKVNSCVNISETDQPNIITVNVIKRLQFEFKEKNMIKENKEDKGVNRPRIDKRKLYLKLVKCLNKSDKTEDEIYNLIKDQNNQYGLKSRTEFKNISENQFKLAKDTGFYLGLDKNFEWLDIIF